MGNGPHSAVRPIMHSREKRSKGGRILSSLDQPKAFSSASDGVQTAASVHRKFIRVLCEGL